MHTCVTGSARQLAVNINWLARFLTGSMTFCIVALATHVTGREFELELNFGSSGRFDQCQ
jgi:hypothetical protein